MQEEPFVSKGGSKASQLHTIVWTERSTNLLNQLQYAYKAEHSKAYPNEVQENAQRTVLIANHNKIRLERSIFRAQRQTLTYFSVEWVIVQSSLCYQPEAVTSILMNGSSTKLADNYDAQGKITSQHFQIP